MTSKLRSVVVHAVKIEFCISKEVKFGLGKGRKAVFELFTHNSWIVAGEPGE
jgi:hypothetical protein